MPDTLLFLNGRTNSSRWLPNSYFNSTIEIHSVRKDVDIVGEKTASRRSISSLPIRLPRRDRSEEHTSDLQSPDHLVSRLLLENKKKKLQMKSPFPDPKPAPAPHPVAVHRRCVISTHLRLVDTASALCTALVSVAIHDD